MGGRVGENHWCARETLIVSDTPQTCNPALCPDQESHQWSVCRMTPNPLSHTSQGEILQVISDILFRSLLSRKNHNMASPTIKFQNKNPFMLLQRICKKLQVSELKRYQWDVEESKQWSNLERSKFQRNNNFQRVKLNYQWRYLHPIAHWETS